MLFKAHRQRRAIADTAELEAQIRKLEALIEEAPDEIRRRMEEDRCILEPPPPWTKRRCCGPRVCHGIRVERRRTRSSAFPALLLLAAGVSLLGWLLLAITG